MSKWGLIKLLNLLDGQGIKYITNQELLALIVDKIESNKSDAYFMISTLRGLKIIIPSKEKKKTFEIKNNRIKSKLREWENEGAINKTI